MDGDNSVFPCVPLQGPTCGLHTIVWEPSVKIMQCRKWAFVFLQYRRNFLKCHAVFHPPQGFSSFFGCFQFLSISLFLKVKSQAHFLRKKQSDVTTAAGTKTPRSLTPPPTTHQCMWVITWSAGTWSCDVWSAFIPFTPGSCEDFFFFLSFFCT